MQRNRKFYKGKEIRKLYTEYSRRWSERFTHGEWIKVEPYQKGWTRFFVLRDDISRRTDAPWIQRALDLVNTFQYNRNKEFTRYDRGKREDVPIEQYLGWILEKDYEAIDKRVAKYLNIRKYHTKTYGRDTTFDAYGLKHDYWTVFAIEPNIIVERWVPDPKWESRIGELALKIERHNLWPKIGKELGWSVSGKSDWGMSPYLKNKRGINSDFELEY